MKAPPLHILRIIPVLDFGGVESLFLTQARHWDHPTMDVEYLTFWKDGRVAERMRALGATVHVLGVDPSIRNPRATWALRNFLREHQPDLVHSVIGEANFHTMLLAPFSPWRTVIEEGGIPGRRLRNRLVHTALYRGVDAIIAVSDASKNYLIDREFAPKSRIYRVNDAIHAEFYDIRRQKPYNSADICLRAVGRLASVKNYPMLIDAFAQAVQSAPQIRLEIVGDGPQREQLADQIQARGMEDHIRLHGFCDDIADLHRTTHWLLMPSHSEGFGIAAAEAMAAGVPVIGSNVGGLPEVLGDLAARWTLPPTDRARWTKKILAAAAMDTATYNELSTRARAHAMRFHPERYVKELARVYDAVASHRTS